MPSIGFAALFFGELPTLVGALGVLTILFGVYALKIGNTAYVVAIRNASILFSIIFGVIWLKEKDLKTKLFAGLVIFAGLLLIKVFG